MREFFFSPVYLIILTWQNTYIPNKCFYYLDMCVQTTIFSLMKKLSKVKIHVSEFTKIGLCAVILSNSNSFCIWIKRLSSRKMSTFFILIFDLRVKLFVSKIVSRGKLFFFIFTFLHLKKNVKLVFILNGSLCLVFLKQVFFILHLFNIFLIEIAWLK